MTKFVSRVWFNARNAVGVVLVYDEFVGYKSYIGACIPGNSEDEDIREITNYGAKFPLEAAKTLFPHIDFNSKPEFYEEY